MKHGIDFVEAQALWFDPDRIETDASPREGEHRFLVVEIGADYILGVNYDEFDVPRVEVRGLERGADA